MDRSEDLDRLAADWIALWESELTALGQDAELAEAWAASVALTAGFWRAQGAQLSAQLAAMRWRAHDPPVPPPGAAPTAAPPDAGGGAGDGGADGSSPGLRSRIADLEQRLAALEGGPGGGGADRPRARRPRSREPKP